MRRKVWAGILVPSVALVGLGGYAVADALDVVPGLLTIEPEPVAPAPFLAHGTVVAAPPLAGPVTDLSDTAPMPDAAAIQALAQAVRDDSRTGRSTNVVVVDVLTGTVLADVSATETQVPASTTKTLTAVAALSALGPDFTTRTVVTWKASSGQLSLVTSGDIMLAAGHGHGGKIHHANGWAGLGDLADEVVPLLEAAGATRVTLLVDDSAFPGPAIHTEWPGYALGLGYVAGVTGLAVNVAKLNDEPYAQRHRDSSLAAGNDFAVQLQERGIVVDRVSRGMSPAAAVEVAAVESAPLSLVAEYLLHVSDNAIAQNVARVLAIETGYPATERGAADAIVAQLAAMGVDTDGLVIYDAAGYSTRNRISPMHLTDAMIIALTDPGAEGILDYLPVGGIEGTVAERYTATDAAGLVRAKTGSLTGVTALAGVVSTADGRLLAFAVLSDGMPYGQERPQAAANDFVNALAQCGCTS